MRLIPFLLPWILSGDPAAESVDRLNYVRPSGKEFVPESEFTLRKTKTGSSIESVTGRGNTRLTVSAHYDEGDRLTGAAATLVRDDQKKAVTVVATAGKARVQRAEQQPQEFEVPPGIIVTSAPDWTDTLLLCRRYDHKTGGKQSFPGLWIHPEQAGQRLTFAIERTGEDTVAHAGKKLKLSRYTIWLRGNSRYAAWADENGKMMKLVPLPYKENASNWLVLGGYEQSVSDLGPPEHLRDQPLGRPLGRYRATGEDKYLDPVGRLLIPNRESFGWYEPLTK